MPRENGSASASERTLACPSWLALPHVARSDSYTDRGHGRHGFVRALLDGVSMDQALAAVKNPADRETCRRIDWQKLCGDLEDIEAEVAYAIDVKARTARRLGKNIAREYGELGPWEVPGTLDIQGRRSSDGVRVVVDLKSGWKDVTEAERNAQLLFFAAVFQLLEGSADPVECRIAKLKGSGDIWNDVATFGAWDVDNFLDLYEQALDDSKESRRVYLAGGTPDVAEGPWCAYCEAADACPGKTRLARAMIQELGPLETRIETMSPEDAGRAYVLAHDRVAPLLGRVMEALKERARREPLPLPDGLELRETSYEKVSMNTEALVSLARELGATDGQIAGCQRSAIVRPIRPCKPRHVKRLRRAG